MTDDPKLIALATEGAKSPPDPLQGSITVGGVVWQVLDGNGQFSPRLTQIAIDHSIKDAANTAAQMQAAMAAHLADVSAASDAALIASFDPPDEIVATKA